MDAQKRKTSNQLEKILPANHSILKSCASGPLKLKQSSDPEVNKDNKFVHQSQRRARPNQSSIINLTDDSSLDINPCMKPHLTPYPLKKRKVRDIECKAGQCGSSSCNDASGSSSSMLNAQANVSHKDTEDSAVDALPRRKNKVEITKTSNDDAKGSAFLFQVWLKKKFFCFCYPFISPFSAV